MRISITFLAGFAVGYVAGAQAGHERYEQMVQLGQKVVQHPAVQQATRTAGEKATSLTKAAGQKASERMPKIAETAKSSASKVRGQLDRLPGRTAKEDASATANGDRPSD